MTLTHSYFSLLLFFSPTFFFVVVGSIRCLLDGSILRAFGRYATKLEWECK
jgi:hypothetical protein